MASVITHVTVESLLSDHHVIICRLKLPKPRPARKQITYRKHGAIDNALFECDLLASSFVSAPVGNTQTQCEQYNHELSTIMDKHAPTIRQTTNVRPRQPWRTDDLQSMRRDVRRAERKWRQTRLVVHRQIYTDVRDAFKKGIATAKSTYYCGQIESSANDARKMFRVAGDLMGCSRLPLAPNGDDSAVDLAERFSAHYVAKIIQLHSHLTVASVPSHPPLLADNDECSVAEPLYVFQPATVEAITKLSMDASSKVCPRIDVLTAVLLRSHMSTLAPVLTRLVNSSIESSTVPAAMKHATITPLLKKPGLDVDNMSSYRPISKLSFDSKVLEKHIAIQIQHHMETHNLFDTFQSAYRPHHSCETAIVRIQDVPLLTLLIMIYSCTNFTRSVCVDALTAGLNHTCLHEHKLWRLARQCRKPSIYTVECHKAACSVRFSLTYTALILPMCSVTIQYIITCMRTTHNCMWSFLMGRWSTLRQMLSACHGVSLT